MSCLLVWKRFLEIYLGKATAARGLGLISLVFRLEKKIPFLHWALVMPPSFFFSFFHNLLPRAFSPPRISCPFCRSRNLMCMGRLLVCMSISPAEQLSGLGYFLPLAFVDFFASGRNLFSLYPFSHLWLYSLGLGSSDISTCASPATNISCNINRHSKHSHTYRLALRAHIHLSFFVKSYFLIS